MKFLCWDPPQKIEQAGVLIESDFPYMAAEEYVEKYSGYNKVDTVVVNVKCAECAFLGPTDPERFVVVINRDHQKPQFYALAEEEVAKTHGNN